MNKIVSVTFAGACAILLSACANGIPECNNNQLDGCGRGGPYTDERTAVGRSAAPAPVIAPAVIEQPAPVAQPASAPVPAPAPEPVDTSIMRQAPEPDMSK